MPTDRSKDSLRARILLERNALSSEEWERSDAARTAAVLASLPDGVAVVAAYASRPGEPGTAGLIEALAGRGIKVLLPVISRQPDWARFTSPDDLVPGWGRIPQPAGPALGGSALVMADLVLAPCLAVACDGVRLGTGGGWYDRALASRRPGVPVWALARAAEVLDALPSEPHDVPVDAVVTEAGHCAIGEAAGN